MGNSATKRIAKNFSWLLVGSVISGGLNFLTIVYLARKLGVYSFGLFQFAQAFLVYLLIIVDSGLSTFGIREISNDKSRSSEISINIIMLRLLLATIIFVLSALMVWILPLSQMLRLLFAFTFSLVFYRALNTDWIFQGLEKMEYVAVSKSIFSAVLFILVILFVKSPTDLIGVPLMQLVSGLSVAGIFLAVLFTRLYKINLSILRPDTWVTTFVIAVPLGISTVFMQIYDNLDTIMLGIMDSPVTVGVYNAAYQIFYIFAGVFSLWLAAVLPVACKRMNDDRARVGMFLEKFMRLTLLLTIPVTVLVCLAAPLIIQLFFGSGYSRSILALQCLIWALIPMVVCNTYGSLVLIPAGLFKKFMASVAAGALANIILNIILIPKFSYLGAAAATILAQAVAGIFALQFSRKLFHLGLLKYSLKPLVISLAAFFVSFLTYSFSSAWGVTVRLLASNMVYFAVAGILLVYYDFDFISEFIGEIFKK